MKELIILILTFHVITCKSIKKNLIIGAIGNLSWKKLKPFFYSLYKANFQQYECVMFVINVSNHTIYKLKSIGVKIFQFPKKYYGMKINNVRYKLYEEYLRDKLDKYNIVLHVDVRDTFFQREFFQIYNKKGPFIGFALEDENITEKVNGEWMMNQYGLKIYEEIKYEKAICSGTIWGTVDKFYDLVQNIWEEIIIKSPYNKSIHDQTATNYIIYHKKMFKDFIITTDNYKGDILSLGEAQNRSLYYDFEDNVLDYSGKIKVAVVHQYDRIPELIKKVQKKFSSEKDDNFKLNSVIEYNPNNINVNKISFFLIIMILSLIMVFVIKLYKNLYYMKNIKNEKKHFLT